MLMLMYLESGPNIFYPLHSSVFNIQGQGSHSGPGFLGQCSNFQVDISSTGIPRKMEKHFF